MTASIKIPLIDQTHYSKLRKKVFLIAWGIITLLVCVYFLYQSFVIGEHFSGSYIFNFITVPGLLVVISLSVKSSFLKIDSNTVQYKLNYFKPTKSIPINEILNIKIDYSDVKITTKSGVQHIIDLGDAKHSDIGKIKSILNEIQL